MTLFSLESWPGCTSQQPVQGSREHCLSVSLSLWCICSKTHTGPAVNQATSAKRVILLKVRSLVILSYISRVMTCNENKPKTLIMYMIQSFHHFLIDHLCSEGNSFHHNPSVAYCLHCLSAQDKCALLTHSRSCHTIIGDRHDLSEKCVSLPFCPGYSLPSSTSSHFQMDFCQRPTKQTVACTQISTFSSCHSILNADLPAYQP